VYLEPEAEDRCCTGYNNVGKCLEKADGSWCGSTLDRKLLRGMDWYSFPFLPQVVFSPFYFCTFIHHLGVTMRRVAPGGTGIVHSFRGMELGEVNR
jgi:hypothetical protein